jgi:hypothetical protein
MAKARHAVNTPAPKSQGANTSGTTKEYVNIGNDAKKIAEEITTRKMFMIAPVFHNEVSVS